MNNRLNKYRNPGAKRLMLEAKELKDNTEDYCAQPIDDNLFEWHFTVRGPPDTAFDGGFYHGRLSFPTDYPMKPPSIILLTPNGRFETNKKICLSISGHHPETWQPSWSVRTALLALIAFMPTNAKGAIGSLNFPDSERRRLALKSRNWQCETCGPIKNLLVHPNCNSIDGLNRELPDSSRPGTSRVRESSAEIDSDRQSQSSGSDVQELDSSSDYKKMKKSHQVPPDSALSLRFSKSKTTVISEGEPRVPETDDPQISCPLESLNVLVNSGSLQGLVVERRRNYPSIALVSIIIILSLLIIRRVVMVIQS